jgi:hypothetical protein
VKDAIQDTLLGRPRAIVIQSVHSEVKISRTFVTIEMVESIVGWDAGADRGNRSPVENGKVGHQDPKTPNRKSVNVVCVFRCTSRFPVRYLQAFELTQLEATRFISCSGLLIFNSNGRSVAGRGASHFPFRPFLPLTFSHGILLFIFDSLSISSIFLTFRHRFASRWRRT